MEDLRKYTQKSELYKLLQWWKKQESPCFSCGECQMDYLHRQKKDNMF